LNPGSLLIVESTDKGTTAWIKILNDTVLLPNRYAHQFVFAEWNIEKEQLLMNITRLPLSSMKVNSL